LNIITLSRISVRLTGQRTEKDQVKKDCAAMNLNLIEATRLVEDRRCWRETVWHLGCLHMRTSSSS